MELVTVKNLFFDYFDNEILHNVNLSIKENEIVLLIGANGAGKSTLLRVLSGFHLPKKCEDFKVLGTHSPQDQFKGLAYLGNKWQRNISFCGVSPYMADIRAGDMMKIWQNENIERRDELVKVLDINLDWKMHQVSDGQRKRVQIMLALLKPYKLLVIDEFLNELDVVIRDRFKKYKNNENLIRLSKEMRKNGWGFQSKDKEEYFYHPTYDNKKMVNFVYCNTPDGKFYPVPILDRANDKEGLGCSIVTCHSSLKYDVESNEWLDGFKTRKGKRRVKYFDYLDKRQEKKNSFIFNH